MNSFEKFLKSQLKSQDQLEYPGCKIQVYFKGKLKVDLSWRKTYHFYDLASLTKIIFTTQWYMDQVSKGLLSVESPVVQFLPWYLYKDIKIKQLLNHSAGNSWWQPFYKSLTQDLSVDQKYQQLEKLCQTAPIEKQERAVYSDIDFFLLGSVMQRCVQKPLFECWQDLFESYYSRTHFHFRPLENSKNKKSLYAPTENCPWRNKILQGEVHDENAWALGGVGPHAGLFGTIDDLSSYGLGLREALLGKSKILSAPTVQHFIQRSLPASRGDWGLGFMLPSPSGSSAGERFDKSSFGHTGFTGTSFWFDPKKDLFVSILSNRVHPSRKNRDFVSLRPQIHNWVMQYVEEQL